MKLQIIKFFICCLLSVVCCLLPVAYSFAADLDVETGGELSTETLTLDGTSFSFDLGESTGQPEGRVAYSGTATELGVSDGTNWQAVGLAKTVATRIVAVDRNLDNIVDTGDSLNPDKADTGLVCDGAGDQVQINTAISQVSTAGGGVVYLLEGTYNIAATINMAANVSLIGTGAGTVLQQTTENITAIIAAGNASNILISRLKILGMTASGTNFGISFVSNVTDSNINKVWVDNTKNPGINVDGSSNNTISGNHLLNTGISLINSDNNIVRNNTIVNAGISVSNSGDSNLIAGNIIDAAIGAISVMYSNDNIISSNLLDVPITSSSYAIWLRENEVSPPVYYCRNNLVYGNNIVYPDTTGNSNGVFRLEGPDNNLISSNLIHNTPINPVFSYKTGVESKNNIILGNLIYDPEWIGIMLGGENNMIVNNLLYKEAGVPPHRGIIVGGSSTYLAGNYMAGLSYINDPQLRISEAGTNTRYTGRYKITLEPDTLTVSDGDTVLLSGAGSVGPRTYVRLEFAATGDITLDTTTAIEDGKAAGDILILENTIASTYDIIIPDNANVQLGASSRRLGTNDTLKLIWNYSDDGYAANDDWLELSFSNN